MDDLKNIGFRWEHRYLFFKKEYPSLKSARKIKDPKTNQQKKYGFLSFIDYNEYNKLINSKKVYQIRGKILRIR